MILIALPWPTRLLSTVFIFMIRKIFSKRKTLLPVLFKRICTSKKSYLQSSWILTVREYDICSVHFYHCHFWICQQSCQQQFSRTSNFWFLLILMLCFFFITEYKADRIYCSSVLWSIVEQSFSKRSYFTPFLLNKYIFA